MIRLGILAIVLVAGCGPTREPPAIVTGRVVNAGRPVTSAVVYFDKDDGSHSLFVPLDADGKFQMKTFDYGGVPAGTYLVCIKPDPGQGQHLVGDDKKTMSHPLIPPRFMKTETSGLRLEVKRGANPSAEWDLGK